jgi:hypothetical protein
VAAIGVLALAFLSPVYQLFNSLNHHKKQVIHKNPLHRPWHVPAHQLMH